MTGKSYYITTLGEWQRHAARFANSHWIALDSRAPGPSASNKNGFVGAQHAAPGDLSWRDAGHPATLDFVAPASPPAVSCGATVDENRRQDAGATNTLESDSNAGVPQDCQASSPSPLESTQILVLIEADEGCTLRSRAS